MNKYFSRFFCKTDGKSIDSLTFREEITFPRMREYKLNKEIADQNNQIYIICAKIICSKTLDSH